MRDLRQSPGEAPCQPLPDKALRGDTPGQPQNNRPDPRSSFLASSIIFDLLRKIHAADCLGHQIVFNNGHRCRYCGIPLALLSISGESCDSPKYQG